MCLIVMLGVVGAIVLAAWPGPRLSPTLSAFLIGTASTAFLIGVASWLKARRESRDASPEEDVASQNLMQVSYLIFLTLPLQMIVGALAALVVYLVRR